MKGFKILVIIVVVLMAVNCTLIGILWYNHYQKNQYVPVRPVQVQAFDYLIRELNLTPIQVKRYDTLRNQHVTFTRATADNQRTARDSFFDLVKQPTLNKPLANRLAMRVATDQQKLDSATFYHFRSFRAILNVNQQAKFDSIFRNVLHMMAQPHRPQGPPDRGFGPPSQDGLPGQPPANQRTSKGRPDRHYPLPEQHPPGQQFPPDGPPPNGHPPLDPDGRPLHGPPPGGRPPLGPDGQPMGPPPGVGPPPDGSHTPN